MARRPNYGFEKRQRELRKQKKKEEKAERKRLKKEAAAAEAQALAGENDEGSIAGGAVDDGHPDQDEAPDAEPQAD